MLNAQMIYSVQAGFPDFCTSPYQIELAVDLVKVCDEFEEKFNHIPIKDRKKVVLRILLMDIPDEIAVLGGLLPGGKKLSEGIYGNDLYRYCYQTHRGKFGGCKKGSWLKKTSPEAEETSIEVKGGDIFSLIMYHEKCNRLQALEFVVPFLNVKYSDRDTNQPNAIPGYSLVERPDAYPTNGLEDVASLFLPPCHEVYSFYTKYGANYCSMNVYEYPGEEPILLFKTRQRKDNGEYVDTFIAPPMSEVIFNYPLIYQQKHDVINIHDDIRRIKGCSNPGVSTWAGTLDFVSKIEWEILKDGNVLEYVFDPGKLASCKIGAILEERFRGMGKKLGFVICEGRKLNSSQEFYKLVQDIHGLDLNPKEKGIESLVMTLGDLENIENDRPFMFHKLFREKEFVLLVGPPKSCKSIFTMDVCLTLARGGSMGGRFFAEKPCKVFYFDAEMSGFEFELRLKKLIEGNHGNIDRIRRNFKYICLRDLKQENRLDFSKEEDWGKIINLAKGYDFVVFDNLGALFPPYYEQSAQGWKELSSALFEPILQNGSAVWLVHHLNKASVYRGSGKIIDFANVQLSLSKPSGEDEECSTEGTVIDCHIPVARILTGAEMESFTLVYNDKNGQIIRTVFSLDGSPIDSKGVVVEQEIREKGLDAFDIEILKIARGLGYIVAGDLKSDGISDTKVTDHLNKLVKLGLLTKTGEKKGTKYWVAGKEIPTEK